MHSHTWHNTFCALRIRWSRCRVAHSPTYKKRTPTLTVALYRLCSISSVTAVRACVYSRRHEISYFSTHIHTYTQCTALYIYVKSSYAQNCWAFFFSPHSKKEFSNTVYSRSTEKEGGENIYSAACKCLLLERNFWLWESQSVRASFFSSSYIHALKQQICCAWRILLFAPLRSIPAGK